MSESDDVVRAQAGDMDAFERLLMLHIQDVVRLLRKSLASRQDVEDVAQEACLHALAGLPGLRDPQRFGQWFRTVAYNRAMQWQRQKYAASKLQTLLWMTTAPAETSLGSELEVNETLDLLPAPNRSTFALHYLEGMSSAEIARREGVSSGTIRWRLHRARAALLAALNNDNMDGGSRDGT